MAPWEIRWTHHALRDLGGLPEAAVRRVVARVEAAAADPFRHFSRLLNADDYKLRVGAYRVLVLLSPDTRTVLVERVAHRSKAYKRR